ncbi:MAG: single-stranded-DNA-specific exonuclease RecJ [Candidatus Marinimicrobia bacterium]|jgi:single-stranded-DNA-specific exonuclease|nr:single-stranded-DNA-specific exonuclease RecJ [Candidatus Neomarinimicrobiota bacterium]MBT4359606.1 single-stranded-DNA-specific exonuclease RecJ [Candidatus Neomarinimicrobiota bacterium]MBT4713224.1 single-stranded-DNA-specific exonuclease RecJ [Candidatus Neomarinimicrobiota bacterium]MBT4945632.1 single-stranded-DNA-specific exonuclease RecJ [Candidatus Neomarinimicrobiota bacterium]MBT5271548.1 single-stranded-DNA-specific exonuclease RecJ [Candidatus Neomarinimicrobiota bacterium]
MEKIWIIQDSPQGEIENLTTSLGVSPVVGGMLWRRDLRTLDEARQFFNPSISHLLDPFLMLNMDTAVDVISKCLDEHAPILVYGDYDVDGTTAASLLHLFLQSIGAKSEFYIPDRNTEGYGVSHKGIDYAAEIGVKLIITCDCGITAVEQVEYAKQLGVNMMITDHHIPDAKLPDAVAILNPKQAGCEYPNKNLCGAGVAFKLTQAISKKRNHSAEQALQFLDLAAIGTAADIVKVTGENRIIVGEGLKLISRGSRPGIKALKKVAGITRDEVTVSDVLFGLGPRINAVGRLGEAMRAVRLMTSTTQSEAKELSAVLNSENEARKTVEGKIFDEAVRLSNAKYDPREKRSLVLYHEGWHHGVIGIVASKLKERYFVPTVIIAVNDGVGKASARSISGFDLHAAFSKCSDLLLSFGGHTMAAGMSIDPANLEAFEKRFQEVALAQVTEEMMRPRLKIESIIEFSDINSQLMETLRRLAPYGPGNMRPLFASQNLEVIGYPRPKIVGKNHLKFKVRQGRTVMDAIGFGMAESLELLYSKKSLEMAYVLAENEWQGRKTIQLELKDIRVMD